MIDVHPFLISGPEADGKELSALPASHKTFDESWLQELLFKHPSILPVNQIDEAFSPAISIGREIANIDNLFISSRGLLTIVETKLWRNPEAHRTVVAQILDYASTLSTWDYQKLNSSVQSYMEKRTGKAKSLFEIVTSKRRNIEFSEIEFFRVRRSSQRQSNLLPICSFQSNLLSFNASDSKRIPTGH